MLTNSPLYPVVYGVTYSDGIPSMSLPFARSPVTASSFLVYGTAPNVAFVSCLQPSNRNYTRYVAARVDSTGRNYCMLDYHVKHACGIIMQFSIYLIPGYQPNWNVLKPATLLPVNNTSNPICTSISERGNQGYHSYSIADQPDPEIYEWTTISRNGDGIRWEGLWHIFTYTIQFASWIRRMI